MADPDATWAKKGGINWLEHEDMLHKEVSNARIMRFGYDATWWGPNTVNSSLTDSANSLLLALSEKREVSRAALYFL